MINLLDLILEDEIKNVEKQSSGFMSKLKNIFKDKRSEFEVDKHKDIFIEFTNEVSDIISGGISLKKMKEEQAKKEIEKLQKQWDEVEKKYSKFQDVKLLSELINNCSMLITSLFKMDSAVSVMVAGKNKEEYNKILNTIKKAIDDFEIKIN